MKITDLQLDIKSISGIYKGRIPPSSLRCNNRHSDCFVYVLSGEGKYTFDDRPYIASAGDIMYLSHNSNYSINITDENYTFICIDFFFENSKNEIFKNEIYKSKSFSVLKTDFEKLYRFWNFGNFPDKIYCKSLFYKIYSEIAKLIFSQYISQDRRKQIEHIVEYITDNLSDSNLTISSLSKMCNISEVHFRRIFSCIYHISPIRFIMLTRINRAKELLISETCSISEVAERCGFKNHYYFSKIFKSETNMTPSNFRKFYKTNL